MIVKGMRKSIFRIIPLTIIPMTSPGLCHPAFAFFALIAAGRAGQLILPTANGMSGLAGELLLHFAEIFLRHKPLHQATTGTNPNVEIGRGKETANGQQVRSVSSSGAYLVRKKFRAATVPT
jgi:hypothetical protein